MRRALPFLPAGQPWLAAGPGAAPGAPLAARRGAHERAVRDAVEGAQAWLDLPDGCGRVAVCSVPVATHTLAPSAAEVRAAQSRRGASRPPRVLIARGRGGVGAGGRPA
jgi:hypothetical protein